MILKCSIWHSKCGTTRCGFEKLTTPGKMTGILIWADVTPGGRGTGKPWFIINPGLVETNTDIAPIGGLPKGASAAAKLTGIGYNVEIALPIDYFETLGRDGTSGNSEVYIRLNFAVNDLDRKDEGPVSLFWHPAWLREKRSRLVRIGHVG